MEDTARTLDAEKRHAESIRREVLSGGEVQEADPYIGASLFLAF